MMQRVGAFRTLTGQLNGEIASGMNKEQLTTHMRDGLRAQIAEGVLDEAEIQMLAGMMFELLDQRGSGDVGVDEFLLAASSDESISLKDLGGLYDSDRKVPIAERLLGNIHQTTQR